MALFDLNSDNIFFTVDECNIQVMKTDKINERVLQSSDFEVFKTVSLDSLNDKSSIKVYDCTVPGSQLNILVDNIRESGWYINREGYIYEFSNDDNNYRKIDEYFNWLEYGVHIPVSALVEKDKQLSSYKAELEKTKEKLSDFEKISEDKKKIESQLNEKEGELSSCKAELQKTKEELSDFEKISEDKKKIESQLNEKEGELSSCKAELQKTKEELSNCGKNSEDAKKIESQLNEKEGELSSCKAELQKTKEELSNCGKNSEDVKKIESQLKEKEEELSSCQAELQKTKETLSACQTHSAGNVDIEEKVKLLETELSEARKSLEEKIAELKVKEKEVAMLNTLWEKQLELIDRLMKFNKEPEGDCKQKLEELAKSCKNKIHEMEKDCKSKIDKMKKKSEELNGKLIVEEKKVSNLKAALECLVTFLNDAKWCLAKDLDYKIMVETLSDKKHVETLEGLGRGATVSTISATILKIVEEEEKSQAPKQSTS